MTFLQAPPFFEPQHLRETLTALHREAGADAMTARPKILKCLKELNAYARGQARTNLELDGNGRRCAEGLSSFQDALIALIYDYTTTHVYRATNPSDAERMAIIATGGYGRSLLAPGSDIDLLFLLPYKQTPWGESVAEHMLYLLWDLGFKVGHATRTVAQCVKYGADDMVIRTSMLDSRFIYGDSALFREFETRFQETMTPANTRAFIDAKMEERDARHKAAGDTRYMVEPNVKDGKGGLRDLHTLHWITKMVYGRDVDRKLVNEGVFTEEEVATFKRCEDFLWTVRCFLHFLAGRAEERLSFDVQPDMADRLGYRGHAGLSGVERFMKHYFLTAKDVGDLTTILCGTVELRQLKTSPAPPKLFNPLTWALPTALGSGLQSALGVDPAPAVRDGFRIENDRIDVVSEEVFTADPVNVIRYFAEAARTESYLHPNTIRLLRRMPRLVTKKVRQDPEANQIFIDLLTNAKRPATTLRRMNESGVLGRFIPAWRRVVGMMQFNMYHHYTVDEHLLRTVATLTEMESGDHADELPLATQLFPTLSNRKILYVAAFLHDIGKGRIEDHSIVGAKIAADLCPRLGLSKAETDSVVWLIEEHLTMSNIAQSRDITDPKTISDFARIVRSPERLKMLMLLTVADIRAVGPATWNGWKGQLIRSLYYETEPMVAGGHTAVARSKRVEAAQAKLMEALADWSEADRTKHIDRFFDDYWLRFELDRHVAHAKLMRRATDAGKKLETAVETDAFTAITELTIYAVNHPRLLSLFAGSCSAVGANIVGASITSTRDGFALDSFLIQREGGAADDYDEMRRAENITDTIDKLLHGRGRLQSMLDNRRPAEHRVEAFDVPPEVIINNAASNEFTVIEVAGRDRPGLLYDLTTALSDLMLDISSAHITTFGEKAVDVFYVTDLTHRKITQDRRQRGIAERLEAILEAD